MAQIGAVGYLMPYTGMRIKGAAELERAFLQLRKEVLSELRPALREIAEVVRDDATFPAQDQIRNIGPVWSQMRIGVTLRAVYVAPKARRRGGSPRPNLGGLLMDRALQPALDRNVENVMHRLDEVVSLSARKAGF